MTNVNFAAMEIDQRRFWPEVLPGWKMGTTVVSRYDIKILMIDDYGRKAGTTGSDDDLDIAIATCEQYAFDIEKQISKEFNKFLFDLFKLKLSGITLTAENYNLEDFGSWIIQIDEKRIVLDGKDFILIMQYKNEEFWSDLLCT